MDVLRVLVLECFLVVLAVFLEGFLVVLAVPNTKQKTIRDSLTHELKFGSNPKYIVSNWMYIFFEKRMYHI